MPFDILEKMLFTAITNFGEWPTLRADDSPSVPEIASLVAALFCARKSMAIKLPKESVWSLTGDVPVSLGCGER